MQRDGPTPYLTTMLPSPLPHMTAPHPRLANNIQVEPAHKPPSEAGGEPGSGEDDGPTISPFAAHHPGGTTFSHASEVSLSQAYESMSGESNIMQRVGDACLPASACLPACLPGSGLPACLPLPASACLPACLGHMQTGRG